MHTVQYLENEDTMMEDDHKGAGASDIHEVSFETNDSTLIDEGEFIQFIVIIYLMFIKIIKIWRHLQSTFIQLVKSSNVNFF